MLANCYLELEDYQNAVDQLEIVARIKQPPTRKLCITLGDLYAKIDLPAKAAQWFIKAYKGIENAPANDRFYIGSLLLDAGRIEDALAWLTSLEENDKEYLPALGYTAQIYLDRNETEKALEYLSIVRRLKPSDGFSHLTAGDLYLEQQKLEKAGEAYARASGLPSTRAEGLAGQAEVFYARKDLSSAVAYYRKALKADPENKRYRVALQQIQRELEIQQNRAS
jgi:tetratricopeptide (TPR) repeat protein